MRTKLTLLAVLFCFTTIQSQSKPTDAIFSKINIAKKKKPILLNYINKIASTNNDPSLRNYYAKKTRSKAHEIAIILKDAHRIAIAYQSSKKGDKYKKLRIEISKLEGFLYDSFSNLEQIEDFVDYFLKTDNNNSRKKYYYDIGDDFKDFTISLEKADDKTLAVSTYASFLKLYH